MVGKPECTRLFARPKRSLDNYSWMNVKERRCDDMGGLLRFRIKFSGGGLVKAQCVLKLRRI